MTHEVKSVSDNFFENNTVTPELHSEIYNIVYKLFTKFGQILTYTFFSNNFPMRAFTPYTLVFLFLYYSIRFYNNCSVSKTPV